MIYIDTNVAIPIFVGKLSVLPGKAKKLIERSKLLMSPMVKLELQYMFELGRIKVDADEVLKKMQNEFDIKLGERAFRDVCNKAESISWTRDTFDRLIVAEAMLANMPLITSDRTILAHYKKAVW